MTAFLGFVGLICSILIIKYRESVADSIGTGAWMDYFGGVYNVIIITSVILFFLSVAAITGTLEFFLSPIRLLLPNPSTVDNTLNMP